MAPFLQEAGVKHRDIAPRNIVQNNKYTFALCDFGGSPVPEVFKEQYARNFPEYAKPGSLENPVSSARRFLDDTSEPALSDIEMGVHCLAYLLSEERPHCFIEKASCKPISLPHDEITGSLLSCAFWTVYVTSGSGLAEQQIVKMFMPPYLDTSPPLAFFGLLTYTLVHVFDHDTAPVDFAKLIVITCCRGSAAC